MQQCEKRMTNKISKHVERENIQDMWNMQKKVSHDKKNFAQ